MTAVPANNPDGLPAGDISHVTMKDGASLRLGVFGPAKGKPTGELLVSMGRGEMIEKYAENLREWTAKGLRVTIYDPYGQGGSTRGLPAEPMKNHIPSFDIHLAHAREVIEKWDAGRDKSVPSSLFAHSMGGHIQMRTLGENPELQKKFNHMIFSAPMMTMSVLGNIGGMRPALQQTAYAPFEKSFDPSTYAFEKNKNTSDPTRYAAFQDVNKRHPELKVGSVTNRWLQEAHKSIGRSDRFAEIMAKKGVPLLDPKKTHFILPTGDETVPHEAALKKISRLGVPASNIHKIEGAKHEVHFEADKYRKPAMKLINGIMLDQGKRAGLDSHDAPVRQARAPASAPG